MFNKMRVFFISSFSFARMAILNNARYVIDIVSLSILSSKQNIWLVKCMRIIVKTKYSAALQTLTSV